MIKYVTQFSPMKKALIVLLALILLLPAVGLNASARSVKVEYQGEEEIIVRGNMPVYLNFTLTNIFNRSLDVEITLPYSPQYKVKYIPSQAFRMLPYESKNISIIITPEKGIEREEFNLAITFSIYEIDAVTPIEERVVHISILVINPSWFLQPLIRWVGAEDNWLVQFFITVLFWLIIGAILVLGIAPVIRKLTHRTKTKIDDIVWNIINLPIIVLLFVYGFVAAMDILPISAQFIALINKIYEVTMIVVVTYLVYKVFHDIMIYESKELAKKTKSKIDDILLPVVEKIGDIVIFIAGFLWLLTAFDIDITVFLVGLGGVGLIIGLAAQDVLSNFFAGMHILLDHPFSIGDYIKLEGTNTVYRIEKVGVRSTKAYDVFNHEQVIIPNKMLAGDKIINMMKPDEMGKVKFSVGVAYGIDVDKVIEIIEDVVNAHPEIIKTEEKKPLVRLVDFGDSSLNFLIIAWIPNIMDQWRVAHELRISLYNRFREAGIEIPFPQLDVHIKDMPVK